MMDGEVATDTMVDHVLNHTDTALMAMRGIITHLPVGTILLLITTGVVGITRLLLLVDGEVAIPLTEVVMVIINLPVLITALRVHIITHLHHEAVTTITGINHCNYYKLLQV
jgi:hypothetical protein